MNKREKKRLSKFYEGKARKLSPEEVEQFVVLRLCQKNIWNPFCRSVVNAMSSGHPATPNQIRKVLAMRDKGDIKDHK